MSQIRVELQETMGNDRRIAEAAWTSSTTLQGKDKRTDDDVERVVNMLADAKHSTPFESVVLRFWIKMPIATDRQFMTHRLQSASGMSGRYRTMPAEWYEIPVDVEEIMSRVSFEHDRHCGINYMEHYDDLCQEANNIYINVVDALKRAEAAGLITNGEMKRGREFFRGQLPQHNMTERVSIMNLRAFCNFIKLRTKEDAQPEIREVANLMLEAVRNSGVCPVALAALERNNWVI
jgi:thymidylate synthase (FAD)